MDQSDDREENSATNLQSCLENNHRGNDFISHMPTMEAREQICSGFSVEDGCSQHTGGLDESCEDNSPPTDMSSALRSVALMRTWDLKKFHSPLPKLVSRPGIKKVNSALSSVDDEGQSDEGEADPAEEDLPKVSFQSKYIQFFPLYQDYCLQEVKEDLLRLKESFISKLITPQCLQSLQSHLSPCYPSQIASSQESPTEVPLPSPPPRPVRVTPCTLWQDLDEVKASGLLSSLTTREIRLQESLFELIGSEASYLRSLRVAVNHFYASQALKQTLSQREHHILFSNIPRVMAASEKFLMDLELRLGESVFISQIGDIVLKHCQGFRRLYVSYVTNMMYQEALINQQLQQNHDFLCSLKKLESDRVCQRQTLKSFLVLPFQRITRIKLLLETILKQTEPESESVSTLKKAIGAVHEIVTECDKGVRKMKQIEELVCLEVLLDFGKVKSLPLVISSRFLVRQGPLKLLAAESSYNSKTSLIGVYLHLFNDLLIISSKKDHRFKVVDYAEFPTHVTVDHLKPKILGLPTNSFLLHLSKPEQPTAFILVADTSSDKEAWMKALSAEQ